MSGNRGESSTFAWRGLRSGHAVRGQLCARDRDTALATLRTAGVEATALRRLGLHRPPTPVSQAGLLEFVRRLLPLLEAGLSLQASLAILETQSLPQSLKVLVGSLRTLLDLGLEMAEAGRQSAGDGQGAFVASLEAAAASGDLPGALGDYARGQERDLAARQALTGTMTYPALLILVALAVATGMLVFALPNFAKLFAGRGELPGLTQVLLDIAGFLGGPAALWLGVALLPVALFLVLLQWHPRLRPVRDRLMLRLPGLGSLVFDSAWARIFRLLGLLCRARIPLLRALEIAEQSAGNLALEALLWRLRQGVTAGRGLSRVLAGEALSRRVHADLVAIGERAGALAPAFDNLAAFHQQEFDRRVGALAKFLEPTVILVMGVLMSLIMLGMYLPVFQLGTVL